MSALVATASQTVGPFFHFGLTADGAVNATALPPHGARIQLAVRVTDGHGEPVTDAVLEVWYATSEDSSMSPAEASCQFARLPTGADGMCRFELAQPWTGGNTAAHVNLCFFARGLLRHLHTRIYFAGDPRLEGDALLGYVPPDRRATLIARRDPARGDGWEFHLRLQGADETVFFDV